MMARESHDKPGHYAKLQNKKDMKHEQTKAQTNMTNSFHFSKMLDSGKLISTCQRVCYPYLSVTTLQ